MKEMYLISEKTLDKIKIVLQQVRYRSDKDTQKEIDELFLHFNYMKEAPKECKCP